MQILQKVDPHYPQVASAGADCLQVSKLSSATNINCIKSWLEPAGWRSEVKAEDP